MTLAEGMPFVMSKEKCQLALMSWRHTVELRPGRLGTWPWGSWVLGTGGAGRRHLLVFSPGISVGFEAPLQTLVALVSGGRGGGGEVTIPRGQGSSKAPATTLRLPPSCSGLSSYIHKPRVPIP